MPRTASSRIPLPVVVTDARLAAHLAVMHRFRHKDDRGARLDRRMMLTAIRCRARWLDRREQIRKKIGPVKPGSRSPLDILAGPYECPPAGVAYSPAFAARKCNLRRLCPHCWHRQVVEYHDRLAPRFFLGGGPRSPFALWRRTLRQPVYINPNFGLVDVNGKSVVRPALGLRARDAGPGSRRHDQYRLRYATKGGYGLLEYARLSLKLRPGVDDRQVARVSTCWFQGSIVCRQLILTLDDLESLPLEARAGAFETQRVRRIVHPSRRDLIAALGWAAHYPEEALSGNLDVLRFVIEEQGPFKMVATAGVFRGDIAVPTPVGTAGPDGDEEIAVDG